jgi:hypothetical protein
MKTIFALLVLGAFAIPSAAFCNDEVKTTDQQTTQHDADKHETEQPTNANKEVAK